MRPVLLQKSINIKATAEKVWETLTRNDLNQQWFAEFSPGTTADTDWQQGSKAIFVDDSNCGIIAHILVNEPHRKLVIAYDGQIVNGQDDYTSDIAQQVKGGKESYTLQHDNGITNLYIEQDMTDEYADMMGAAWDKALQKVKELSENNA